MILCISHSNDYYTVDIVIKRLKELGKEVYRFNSDDFSHKLNFDYTGNSQGVSVTIQTPDFTFSSKDVEAVWYRKLWGIALPEELDASFHNIYLQEYSTMRSLFFRSLKNIPWMNPMDKDHGIAENKLEQLRLANESGLQIPESLFTNDPEKVKTFFHSVCKGDMIAKLHGSLSRSMSGNAPFFPTTLIREADLDNLDTLAYCPMIFQRNISKAYELRIVYVDGVFFTGKINAETSAKGKTDWRVADDVSLAWEPYVLPDEIAGKLTVMMKKMELFFGAIDMIRQKDGQYLFLEVNPQGEWGMIQRDLGYPIGETIAEKLVARIL
ncbi:MvdC/MvdD family ATP grasp protein [Flavobacterium humi]|uniref:ATP-grasp ribosomal peptide maturase n=1 Tax=Flavobacterium humi TaxID=2562683 RepID=A0A4Z0LAL0_9FLAO|nr:ATP-grasp ribosomal peptide maturase [Flavobacterium humi]TGD59052.1 ATP-grasp ribosomal peptide maturase [Flavobacterium humi]